MYEQLTLENLDKRKVDIQSRIRSLEERINKKSPGFVSIPRQKSFIIANRVIALTITSVKADLEPIRMLSDEIPQEIDYQMENKRNLPDLLRKAFEKQAAVEEQLCTMRKKMNSKEDDHDERSEGRQSAPRHFGASYDLNVMQKDSTPIIYSKYNQQTSPIKNSEFSLDDIDINEGEEDQDQNESRSSHNSMSAKARQTFQKNTITYRSKQLDSQDRHINSCHKRGVSVFGGTNSCKKATTRREENSISKNTDCKSSKFDKYEIDMSSPSNYLQKYIKALKGQVRVKIIQKFDSIVIGQEARNKVIERIQQRIMASMTTQQTLKGVKHEKDSLLSSFDLQNKIRDTLIKKIFEMQDVKKYK